MHCSLIVSFNKVFLRASYQYRKRINQSYHRLALEEINFSKRVSNIKLANSDCFCLLALQAKNTLTEKYEIIKNIKQHMAFGSKPPNVSKAELP